MFPRQARPHPIGVAPVGDGCALAASAVAAHIEGFLNLPCRVLSGLPSPEFALDAYRLQYDAGRIIEAFEAEPLEGYPKVVCVMAGDLFVPIFSHVFGEARLGGRVAVVSRFRLSGADRGGRPAGPEQVLERVAKVALHELGHLFALTHCSDPQCLMHFAGDCDRLDRSPLLFCRYCRRFLAEAVAGAQSAGRDRV